MSRSTRNRSTIKLLTFSSPTCRFLAKTNTTKSCTSKVNTCIMTAAYSRNDLLLKASERFPDNNKTNSRSENDVLTFYISMAYNCERYDRKCKSCDVVLFHCFTTAILAPSQNSDQNCLIITPLDRP